MPILSESQIRQATPRDKAYKLYDSRGLYLMVSTSGAKLWRFKYHFGPAERLLVIGKYPDVTLQRARDKRDAARRLLVDGIDPAIQKQAQKHALANSFGEIALEWLAHQRHAFTPKTFVKATWTINDLLLPFIGKRPITELTHLELLNVFRRLEKRGKNETAHRTRQRCGQIFRYAIATGRATRDLTLDLRGALAPVVTKNHAAVTDPAEIGKLLLAIDSYRGHPATEIALKFAPLVFVRPGELRQAEWTEFDLNGAEWRIPAHKMKMREMHIVPLAQQAVELLRELDPITNRQRYVFSCLRGGDRPMSEAALTSALRRMGYTGDQMTWHGFRTIASTSLNELGFNPDIIELQLAHAERNSVRAAYNRALRLAERRKMMQEWANHLDHLRIEAVAAGRQTVVPSREL
jgi:integrase